MKNDCRLSEKFFRIFRSIFEVGNPPLASLAFAYLFVMINIRGALGYVFRFGDPASSPTYSVRPDWYFYAWDLMLGAIVVLVLLNTYRLEKRYCSLVVVLIAYVIVGFSQADSFYVLGMSRSLLVTSVLFMCVASSSEWIEIRHIDRALECLAVGAVSFVFWQMFQYSQFGILPSHSHEGRLIRYGSFYDDSLVFGILIPMFCGYYWSKFSGKKLLEACVAIVASKAAVLTGSFTAMALMLLFSLWWFRRRQMLAVGIAGFELMANADFFFRIRDVVEFKQGSISGHLAADSGLQQLGWTNLLGVAPMDVFVEIGYLSFMYNFGVVVVLLVLCFHAFTIVKCSSIRKSFSPLSPLYRLSGAAEGAAFALLIANFNLPPIVYPPVYLVVAILSGLVFARAKKGSESCSVSR